MTGSDAARSPRASLLLFALIVLLASGCRRSDAAIAQDIRAQFDGRDEFRTAAIDVITKKGVVLLRGHADGTAQADAVALAASVAGVHKVISQLSATDAAIVRAIYDAFRADPLLSPMPVDVESEGGMVRLISTSTTADQRDRALALARAVPGVLHVEDEMK